jgi:hypothetical protein
MDGVISTRAGAVEVFLSYASKDEEFRARLAGALAAAEHSGIVRLWFDRKVPPGAQWGDQIDEHLETAHVILALVTPAFIASKYCYVIELDRAIQRAEKKEAELYAVLVDSVALKGSSLEFRQYISSDPPPITAHPNQSQAIEMVVNQIVRHAEDLRSQRSSSQPTVWNVAPQVAGFVGRSELLETVRVGFRRKAGATRCQAIQGTSGTGKSAFAREYAHLNRADYEVVWWIRAESPVTRDSDFAALARELGLPHADQPAAIAAVKAWLDQTVTKNNRWLLVFDSAVDPAGVRALLPRRVRGDVVITSQIPGWDDVASVQRLGWLSEAEAMDFLNTESGDRDPEAAAALVQRLQGRPQALLQAAATVRTQQITLADYLFDLQEEDERG